MKKLEPKQKKIIDIVVTCLEVVIVLIAIVASIIIISNPNPTSATVAKGPVKLLPVLSGSMDGDQKDSFKEGDLVIAGNPKNVLQLKEGQIITFKGSEGGYDILITHRIIEVVKDADGNALTYITHGDANPEGSNETVNPYNVLAVYKSHLKGVGNSIKWLQQPTHFLLVIILPLALLFIWNLILFVRMIIQWKMEKAVEKNGGALDEEEIKRKAIEEYLASQRSSENKQGEDNIEDKKSDEEKSETDIEYIEDGGDKQIDYAVEDKEDSAEDNQADGNDGETRPSDY
ncbi:MAG: signal peptidase I [Bacteroides sp.]|nr:signal peptidase I [Bacillota bacterium]MCM1393766.1 signal peptidase I [[Eubacterium] siraeum]MCM1455077.1 signal peptidase I [Bacteroides sp.]